MSKENVELARSSVTAWNERDLDRMLEICSEKMEWVPANPGRSTARPTGDGTRC